MDRKYAAFISYRHLPLDMAVAERLHKKIERYRVPKELRKSPEQKTLGVVFRDRDELPLSNDLTRDIYHALDNSEFLIVICTPDTPKSLWVDREIEHFLLKHDRNHILTVLAAGTPEESIPARITHIYAENGTVIDRREPLCAFIVADQLWKVLWNLQSEFQRLVAAILHKPLDTIRQRARTYRWKVAGAVMAVITAIALGFVGMLVSKNREIRDQLLQTQLNESKTLALVSQNQLDDGDRKSALESALQALPSPGNERPYYAPAETALENALYLYEWPRYKACIRMEEPSGLSKLTISDDGNYALGVIGSARVVCYDLSTQSTLWECPWLDEFAVESLEFLEVQGTVLYTSCGGEQYVLDLQTGQLLYTCSLSNRITPEDYSADERYVALIDGSQAVFFDTHSGEILRSESPRWGDSTWAAGGGYSADEKSFLMVYSGVFDGDRQLWYALINTQTGEILHNVCAYTELTQSISGARIIGLEDGSFFVSFTYEGARLYSRVSAEGTELAFAGYPLPEQAFVRGSIHNRIQLIDGMICIVENGEFRSIDPETCEILAQRNYFGSDEFYKMFADGTLLYKSGNDALTVYQLSEQGELNQAAQYSFPWDFSYLSASDRNTDTFLIQSSDGTEMLIVRKLGCMGTDAVDAQALPIALSGSLVYLPDFCGIYCSPDSQTVYFQDVDTATGVSDGYSHNLYHTDTGILEAVEPLDIPDYTGIVPYDGPVPDVIGQKVSMAVASEDGTLAAFAGADGTFYLRDLKTGSLRSELPKAAYICNSITFLQNGSFVMIGNLGQYTVVDTASGTVAGQFETGYSFSGHNGYHTQIRESEDGSLLFICSSIAEFAGTIVETENWTVLHSVEGLVGYLPATDSLVYVSADYRTAYLQPRLDTQALIALANRVLSEG